MFQFTFGHPFLIASDAAREQALAEWRDMLRKWKARGVRLIGTFATNGQARSRLSPHSAARNPAHRNAPGDEP